MKIGYARVSTTEQILDLQIDALNQTGCERIYQEKISGTQEDRPELKKMMSHLRTGDTLVVYKLDRLGRSTRKLIELVDELEGKGIEFVSIRDNIDTTTAVGKAMFRMLAVLAEMERDLIVERTKAGLEAARARGRKGGRPKKNSKAIEKALRLYDSKEYSVSEIAELTNVSRATLYRAIDKRKLKGEVTP